MGWVAIAEFGEWHPDCPPGKVLVFATSDGERTLGARRRRFLIDREEYDAASKPFQVDPDRHQEVL